MPPLPAARPPVTTRPRDARDDNAPQSSSTSTLPLSRLPSPAASAVAAAWQSPRGVALKASIRDLYTPVQYPNALRIIIDGVGKDLDHASKLVRELQAVQDAKVAAAKQRRAAASTGASRGGTRAGTATATSSARLDVGSVVIPSTASQASRTAVLSQHAATAAATSANITLPTGPPALQAGAKSALDGVIANLDKIRFDLSKRKRDPSLQQKCERHIDADSSSLVVTFANNYATFVRAFSRNIDPYPIVPALAVLYLTRVSRTRAGRRLGDVVPGPWPVVGATNPEDELYHGYQMMFTLHRGLWERGCRTNDRDEYVRLTIGDQYARELVGERNAADIARIAGFGQALVPLGGPAPALPRPRFEEILDSYPIPAQPTWQPDRASPPAPALAAPRGTPNPVSDLPCRPSVLSKCGSRYPLVDPHPPSGSTHAGPSDQVAASAPTKIQAPSSQPPAHRKRLSFSSGAPSPTRPLAPPVAAVESQTVVADSDEDPEGAHVDSINLEAAIEASLPFFLRPSATFKSLHAGPVLAAAPEPVAFADLAGAVRVEPPAEYSRATTESGTYELELVEVAELDATSLAPAVKPDPDQGGSAADLDSDDSIVDDDLPLRRTSSTGSSTAGRMLLTPELTPSVVNPITLELRELALEAEEYNNVGMALDVVVEELDLTLEDDDEQSVEVCAREAACTPNRSSTSSPLQLEPQQSRHTSSRLPSPEHPSPDATDLADDALPGARPLKLLKFNPLSLVFQTYSPKPTLPSIIRASSTTAREPSPSVSDGLSAERTPSPPPSSSRARSRSSSFDLSSAPASQLDRSLLLASKRPAPDEEVGSDSEDDKSSQRVVLKRHRVLRSTKAEWFKEFLERGGLNGGRGGTWVSTLGSVG